MKCRRLFLISFFAPLAASLVLIQNSCSNSDSQPQNAAAKATPAPIDPRYSSITSLISPFFERMGPPKPMDWLSSFNEKGQTFDEYVSLEPAPPPKGRRTIYVLPLGSFSPGQMRVIAITAGYLQRFYELPVVTLPAQTFEHPSRPSDIRKNPYTKAEQVRTGYFIDELLPAQVKPDAAVLLAFTSADLFPDASMSFVFGQANPDKRTAVWSLSRLDDRADFATFLRRTIKIAVHETGHLFSMAHCTKYVCIMSGTNHLQETDSHPLDACPECTAKICWLLKLDPIRRYRNLAEFCQKNGMKEEARKFREKANALSLTKEQ